jgi:hypothetical protein
MDVALRPAHIVGLLLICAMPFAGDATAHGAGRIVAPAGRFLTWFELDQRQGLVQAQYSQATRERVETSARRLLATARKGRPFTTPRGVKRIPIEINGETYGTLWEDADLASLAFGAHWESQGGMRVELVRDGRVIGMMWVENAR